MTTDHRTPIAIIGMSCRAAGVETLDDFWDMVEKAEQRFAPVPADRWYGLDPGVPMAAPPQASLLERIDDFDARFFGIAPRMAAWMDPQQRMILELAWHAVENAGIDPDTLAGEPVGVFVGSFMSDYRERMSAAGRADGAAFPGTMTAFAANRVSYQFGWTGPSMVVDSACSSSLTALALAVRGLRAGDYPTALVASPSIISNGFYANSAYRGGALSTTGVSVPFSASRDGYVRGEGGAALLLKPLPQALADGDPVHAVLHAVGVSHNARGGGLTGTDIPGQQRLMRDTADQAGLRTGDLGYLEAHGSGTPTGDAVELAALAGTAGDPAGPGGKLWVGSVKANIGHLEGAAGLIGLVKAVLVLRYGLIPRVAGLSEVDPALPVGASVEVAAESTPWPRGPVPRYAGINSFGLGGAMAHAIIGDPPVAAGPPPQPRHRHVVPLSGQDTEVLAQLAVRLLAALDRDPAPALAAVAWTLQRGRRAQAVRRVLVAADLDELRAGLRGLATGAPDPARCAAEPDDAAVAGLPEARAWLRGDPADWDARWPAGARGARAHLPGSPFRRRSHWFDKNPPSAVSR